jgi:hypothetical protein
MHQAAKVAVVGDDTASWSEDPGLRVRVHSLSRQIEAIPAPEAGVRVPSWLELLLILNFLRG